MFKKKSKILAAAVAMLTLSTAAAVTGTVAWFTSSNVVSASGMSLQADTEQGINISNEAREEWKESATASHTGLDSNDEALRFIPTTTEDAVTWKHGNSADRNDATASGELTTLVLASQLVDGVAKVDMSETSIHGKNVYLLNKFHLRSSTPNAIEAPKLYINLMKATGSAASPELDRSFRVLVKCEGGLQIFAPFETSADTGAPVAAKNLGEAKNVELAEDVTIPAASDLSTAATFEISVYCYFDGNDSNCKSANIKTSFSTLSIECKFGTEEIA